MRYKLAFAALWFASPALSAGSVTALECDILVRASNALSAQTSDASRRAATLERTLRGVSYDAFATIAEELPELGTDEELSRLFALLVKDLCPDPPSLP